MQSPFAKSVSDHIMELIGDMRLYEVMRRGKKCTVYVKADRKGLDIALSASLAPGGGYYYISTIYFNEDMVYITTVIPTKLITSKSDRRILNCDYSDPGMLPLIDAIPQYAYAIARSHQLKEQKRWRDYARC